MNKTQQQLVWSGAAVAALLGFAAANELGKPSANCRDELVKLVDNPSRSVTIKSRRCN